MRPALTDRSILLILAMALSCLLGGVVVWVLQGRHAEPPVLQFGVPRFDENFEARLMDCTPSELAAYARQMDGQSLNDAYHVIFDAVAPATPDRTAEVLAERLPVMAVLANELADRGYSRGAQAEVRFLRETPLAQIQRAIRLEGAATRIYAENELGADERYRRWLALSDSLANVPVFRTYIESRLVELAADAGLHDRKLKHLEQSIELARRQGRYPMLSQLLGTMCVVKLEQGERDAALELADEALSVAMAARVPMQAGRVYYILAADHASRGELGLASEYFDAATTIAHELDGRYSELRYLVLQLRFQARLGCWDLVGRNLPRMELLARNVPITRAQPMNVTMLEPAARLRAAYTGHIGDITAADSLYAEARELARVFPRDYVYARCMLEWAELHLEHDQPQRGIELAREGLEYTAGKELHRDGRKLTAALVEGYLDAGDIPAAQTHHLAMLAVEPADDDDVFRDAILGLRLAATTGDQQAIRAQADAALREMATALESWGPRLETYLMLHGRDFLRELLHRHFTTSVEDGLALELAWSGIRDYALETTAPDLRSFRDFGQRRLADLSRWCVDHGHRAVLFAELDAELGCWTVCRTGVRYRAVMLSELEDMRSQLPSAVAAAALAGELPSRELQAALQRAAAVLMPGWCFDDAPEGGVLLSLPAALRDLPLEALDMDPGPEYVPLAAQRPVAYMSRRGVSQQQEARHRDALVVAMPRPSAALLRQQPSLRFLPRVEAEARRAQAALPGAVLLSGTEASKPAILDRLSRSRFLYIAGHATQDPDMPYRTFLPCAVGATSTDPRDARLDLSDILAQDLSGCELVVLSNCRSGSGRTTRHTVGPSLADAFTDAGAEAVIATRWPVEDAEAGEFMARFFRHWQVGGGETAWDALVASQREDMNHSLSWLNYRLEFGVLPPR